MTREIVRQDASGVQGRCVEFCRKIKAIPRAAGLANHAQTGSKIAHKNHLGHPAETRGRSRKSAYVNFRAARPMGGIAPVTEERSLARLRKTGEPTTPSREPGRRFHLPRTHRAGLDAHRLGARARSALERDPRRRRARAAPDIARGAHPFGGQPRARGAASTQTFSDQRAPMPALRLDERPNFCVPLSTVRQAARGAS